MAGICRDADINSRNGATYCRLMVSRINLISTVMSCSTFDMSVTCSFIGIKVRKKCFSKLYLTTDFG